MPTCVVWCNISAGNRLNAPVPRLSLPLHLAAGDLQLKTILPKNSSPSFQRQTSANHSPLQCQQ